jgi:hypothetical protein
VSDRAPGRRLAREALERGEPLAWFEELYDDEDPPVRRLRATCRAPA